MKNRNFITRILLLATVIAIGSLLVFPPNSICEVAAKVQDKNIPAPVEQTGQTVSYYDYDDGDLQRGVPWPDPRFTDNEDGTVTDNLTHLMWTRDANQFIDEMSWVDAVDACRESEFADHADWYLPNVKELQSLIDYSRAVPNALPRPNPFINVESGYWSSTSWAHMPNTQAWYVRIGSGEGGDRSVKEGNLIPLYVWCVRGGQ